MRAHSSEEFRLESRPDPQSHMKTFAIDFTASAPPLGADGQAQKRTLRGRIVTPETGTSPYPVVLIAHGYTSFMDWGFLPVLSQRLADLGIASLRWNFSGSGIGPDLTTMTEPGQFEYNSYLHELEDLAILRNALDSGRWPELDSSRCSIVGHSRGGAMALIHAAERGDYQAVVTWAAMDHTLQFSARRQELWKQQGYLEVMHWTARRRLRLDVSTLLAAEDHADRLDVLAASSRLDSPWLIVMGDADQSLPFAVAERLYQAAGPKAQLFRVHSGDHTFGARHPMPSPPPSALEQVLQASCSHLVSHGL